MNNDNSYISGWKTPDDWRAFCQRLKNETGAEIWEEAYKEYFLDRLNLRYLHPIKVLQENGTFSGEGFSILAILCTLVEFLESTIEGLKYRFVRHDEKLGEHEYSSSKNIFVNFLCERHPFRSHFDKELAEEFYRNIRCGLLHEAQTKNSWKVWAKSHEGKIIDKEKKIVFRDNFMQAVQEFIEDYGIQLKNNQKLQQAFIRKYDSLCE